MDPMREARELMDPMYQVREQLEAARREPMLRANDDLRTLTESPMKQAREQLEAARLGSVGTGHGWSTSPMCAHMARNRTARNTSAGVLGWKGKGAARLTWKLSSLERVAVQPHP